MSSPVDASSSAQTTTSNATPTNVPATSSSVSGPPKPKSGVRVALEFSGIPPSWFEKRPRLPSRNWLIFWGVVATTTGYYIYDRRECKRIRKEYVDRVSPLAQVPLHSLDLPRKVVVYGAKWPGDEDHERNIKHFRKYVKPILHAAAIDYDMISGKRTGDIADRIADEIRSRRRVMAGIDPAPVSPIPLAANRTPEERRQRELAGGIVIVGRGTMKEFFSGLSRGWTEGLRKVDKEAELAHILEEDGTFDEPDEPSLSADLDGEPIPTPSKFNTGTGAPIFSPLQAQMRAMEPKTTPPATKLQEPLLPADADAPPTSIPALPPLLLVENTNRIGLSQIPMMIWEWFNERHRVQAGSEAAYRLVRNVTRPFTAPSPEELDAYRQQLAAWSPEGDTLRPTLPESDLAFDRVGEAAYKRSLNKWPEEVEEARKEYYNSLPTKLATARALARRTREPTKDELPNPPPTEMELRQERMKREQRWRADMAGWDMIKPDSEVAWDERFRNALRVFADAPEEVDKSA